MLSISQRFNFGNEVEKAFLIDATDAENVKINGTEKFQRVALQKEDVDSLKLPYEKIDVIGWRKRKPLGSGKYKVIYNNTDYFMTYLDELDLFTQVVQQQ